jgi:hypothetical protein
VRRSPRRWHATCYGVVMPTLRAPPLRLCLSLLAPACGDSGGVTSVTTDATDAIDSTIDTTAASCELHQNGAVGMPAPFWCTDPNECARKGPRNGA